MRFIPPNWLVALLSLPHVPRMAKLGPEARIAIALATELRAASLQGRFNGLWLHIPNEGKRSHFTAAVLKAQGMISGAPDYLFMRENFVAALELKAAKSQTPAQIAFEKWCRASKVDYRLAYSAAEALDHLRDWQFLPEV